MFSKKINNLKFMLHSSNNEPNSLIINKTSIMLENTAIIFLKIRGVWRLLILFKPVFDVITKTIIEYRKEIDRKTIKYILIILRIRIC